MIDFISLFLPVVIQNRQELRPFALPISSLHNPAKKRKKEGWSWNWEVGMWVKENWRKLAIRPLWLHQQNSLLFQKTKPSGHDVTISHSHLNSISHTRTMIFNKSFKKGKKVKLKDDSTGEKPGKDRLLSLWIREIRGVYLWICMAFASRVLIRLLCDLASFRTTNTMPEYFWRYTSAAGSDDVQEFTGAMQEMLKIGSVLAGWALTFMPSKVITLQSPGFIFANPM